MYRALEKLYLSVSQGGLVGLVGFLFCNHGKNLTKLSDRFLTVFISAAVFQLFQGPYQVHLFNGFHMLLLKIEEYDRLFQSFKQFNRKH